MPNWCETAIKVKGYKPEVDEFIRILNADYDYSSMEFSHIPHLFRVFYVEELEYYIIPKTDNIVVAELYCDCAWSAYSCMFPGEHTYYDSLKNRLSHFYGTNIIDLSKNLRLDIEIITKEPVMLFQEHYRIINGDLVLEKEFSFDLDYIDGYDNYQDYKKEYQDTKLTEDEFNNAKRNGEDYIEHLAVEMDAFQMPDGMIEMCTKK